MRRSRRLRHSMLRLFIPYAVVSLVPVLLLGVALGWSYRDQARQRGLGQGRAEAALVAQTAVEPLLGPRPLGAGVAPTVGAGLQRLATRTVRDHTVLRLRLRDLAGRVVYSDDGSGFAGQPEDEALTAARGGVVARLTRLNLDRNDTGRGGVQAVEVYLPLTAGSVPTRVGVLEIYLPYAPIAHDVAAGLRATSEDLALGLVALYLALLAITASVTRRLRRAAAQSTFLAEHDHLTGLPNRAVFHRRTAAILRSPRRRGERVVVAIIDLDRFKAVNDTLGHHRGDELLIQVARRLAAGTRAGDLVARLGGDEFGIVLRATADHEEILCRVRCLIEEEVEIDGLPLSIEASIGYAVAPFDGTTADELLQRADVAMYVAKDQHVGVARYDAATDCYDATSLSLVSELRHAIDADQLVLHYQPKARVTDGRIESVEALVRWQHPVHGLLYPDRFLPLVEQTDLIDRLTDWVLHRALADLDGLGVPGLAVAVNISARNLSNPTFASRVGEQLRDAGVAPGRLIVELTETALLVDPMRATAMLAELAAAGVRVSLDDFGQGQTSLGHLSALPLDELKIDRSFVADLADDGVHAAIVRSIVELGHNLGLQVVAEGVETDEIRSRLSTVGCDIGQGYLFARPMGAGELADFLALATAVGQVFS